MNYLTKRAFADEGTFASFNSVMLGWMQETKKVYDGTLYNVFIGTTETNVGKQIVNIDIDADQNSAGENIAKGMADLFTDMGDYNRSYNDYGFLRSYGDSEIKVIWNSKFFNQVKRIDLPSIFHDEALQSIFAGDVLPARYFGRAVVAEDKGSGKVINANGEYDPTKGRLRSKVEKDINGGSGKASAEDRDPATTVHVFPGDELPAGATVGANKNFEEDEVYVETSDVICKVLVKYPPYASSFETGSSFWNPRSLTETHFLSFSHNTLQYLKNYPFITVKAI